MEAIETFETGGFKAHIYHDETPESPREWSTLGTMACWHPRYNLGDKQLRMADYRSAEQVAESLLPHALILPLYLYDHSGLTMRTTSFGDPWDSGQVGWTYVTEEKLREEYSCPNGDIPPETLALAKKVLIGEVETYDQYLRGDVYGYVVEDEAGEHVDSCWGFFGLEYAIGEAKSALASAAKPEAEPKE